MQYELTDTQEKEERETEREIFIEHIPFAEYHTRTFPFFIYYLSRLIK